MYNVVHGIFHQRTITIWYTNTEKFRYDSYLSIFAFILLSYMVRVIAQLHEYYKFFKLKLKRLGDLPTYCDKYCNLILEVHLFWLNNYIIWL